MDSSSNKWFDFISLLSMLFQFFVFLFLVGLPDGGEGEKANQDYQVDVCSTCEDDWLIILKFGNHRNKSRGTSKDIVQPSDEDVGAKE